MAMEHMFLKREPEKGGNGVDVSLIPTEFFSMGNEFVTKNETSQEISWL